MLERTLVDDEIFKVTKSLLGTYRITLKHRNVTQKPPPFLMAKFKEVVREIKSVGGDVSTTSPELRALALELAEAVWGSRARQLRFLATPNGELASDAIAGTL